MIRKFLFFTTALCLGLLTGRAQTDNPMPDKIKPSGLLFQLEEVAQIQASNSAVPKARINMLREVPDGSGRLFVIDLRGFLWELNGDDQELFLSIKKHFGNFIHQPGKGTGFGAFAFHPDYAENGKFYTSHAEWPDTATPDFQPEAFQNIEMQWVLTEWTMDDPAAHFFEGSFREILRVDYPDELHGIQDIQFNPTAVKDSADYGLLYICFGDGGSSLNLQEENIQNRGSFLGTIFRIDPQGSNSANGTYGIPADNPFAGDPNALGEIFCYGFRNPHRICWDPEPPHLMLIGDIGEKNLEEVNIGMPGANYGWGEREGTFAYKRELGRDYVYDLPEDDETFGYTYPVAQFDHDEGLAIVGGYVYRGAAFPELYGHYIFGDIPSGRVFHVPVSEFEQGALAEIKELNFLDENGDRTTFLQLVPGDRADLRFGIDQSGELYFLTKADGKIRKLRSNDVTAVPLTHAQEDAPAIFPNPARNTFSIDLPVGISGALPFEIVDLKGRPVKSGKLDTSGSSIRLDTLPAGVYFVRYRLENVFFVRKLVKF